MSYYEMKLPGTELLVEVEYEYTPPIKGRKYLAYGDPGYPNEYAECTIETVYVLNETGEYNDWADIKPALSANCLAKIEAKILRNPPKPEFDTPDLFE